MTTPRIQWPTQTGWYLVENTVPEGDRLDGGEGSKTIRRVIYVWVAGPDGDHWRGEWRRPGVYTDEGGHLRAIEYYCGTWQGLRFIYLDLDLIASIYDAAQS